MLAMLPRNAMGGDSVHVPQVYLTQIASECVYLCKQPNKHR